MTDRFPVIEALDYLIALHRDDAQPAEAQRRLRALEQRHPELQLDLIWEAEQFDHSLHYDLLIRPRGGSTVSLSYCPDRALPWPLRGVRRWSEADLVCVDGEVLKVQQAIACLDMLWDEVPIMNRLVDVCLIQHELVRAPIELSDAELQGGIDALRRAHGLYDAEATAHWMKVRGLSHAQLERIVADNLTIARLRDRIAEGRVASYFERHRAELDTAHVATIRCDDADTARRLYGRIATGELGFYDAAEQRYLAGPPPASEPRRASTGVYSTLRRGDAPAALTDAVFCARPGQVVGPLATPEGHLIVRVVAIAPAQLDDATRAAIKERIFGAWLTERKQAATIEWNWGRSQPR